MAAGELLFDLLTAGFTVTRDGNLVLVAPKSRLTPEQAAAIRAHKLAVLALLGPESKRMGACSRCSRFAWRPPDSPAVGWICDDCLAIRSEP